MDNNKRIPHIELTKKETIKFQRWLLREAAVKKRRNYNDQHKNRNRKG